MKFPHSLLVAAFTLLASGAVPTYAQTAPKVEGSAGYQFLAAPGLNLPIGAYGDVAVNTSPLLGIVGEFSRGANGATVEDIDVPVSETTFMGGARFNVRGASPKVTPFFQALAGIARVSASASIGGTGTSVTVGLSRFAFQSGGGINYQLSPTFGLRFAGDARYIVLSDSDGGGVERDFRLAIGVVFSSRD